MRRLTHQDHFAGAEASFEHATELSEAADRVELLNVAIYHATMASYLLALEVDARHTAAAVKA